MHNFLTNNLLTRTLVSGSLAIGIGVVITLPSNAALVADILWLVDTSVSMAGDINEVQARIIDFNQAMVDNGIDANYGLVRFGTFESLIQDITDFDTFNAPGGPFQLLTANQGNPESGSSAVNVGLGGATFRSGSVKNFILVTDEDDDSSFADFQAADLGLGSANALFNFIGRPGVGNTDSRYGVLAANHRGSAFDILDFRSNPDPFFENFINTKVQEIIRETTPEPGSLLALLGLGVLGTGSLLKIKKEQG